jgi:hypothetical protein
MRKISFSYVTALLVSAPLVLSGVLPSQAAELHPAPVTGVSRVTQAEKGLATIRIGRNVYQAEVARTPADQAKGLMFRKKLAPGRGMLFVFADEAQRSFWMKNTLIALDIIFITADGVIDSFHTMSPCPDDPCPTYRSTGKVTYALEVKAGEVVRNRVRVGDRISISIPPPGVVR